MLDALKDLGGLERLSSSKVPTGDELDTLMKGILAGREGLKKCMNEIRIENCINGDAKNRGKRQVICNWDKRTGRNVNNGVTVGSCENDARFNLTKTYLNEGCVAVEHLSGYVLQHQNHLVRPVLCANGFCATPNHAIFVNGEYTSMLRLCSRRWSCSEHVKLVNNLKVSANRRARVSEQIVVTPYDIRFPKAAVWTVQIAEDVWNMLKLSPYSGVCVAIVVALVSKIDHR